MKNTVIIIALLFFSNCSRDSSMTNENISFKELTGEKLTFEIKDNPSDFRTLEKYWITLKIGDKKKENFAITSNNGRVFKSELNDYDFMFVPEKIGKLILRIYDLTEPDKECSEIEIIIK
jgi:hypothetical protein